MNNLILCVPETISQIDSTISEESSFYLHKNYATEFPNHIKYDKSKLTIDEVLNLINIFAIFHAKVKMLDGVDQYIPSKIPIDVFKYKELSDGSYYPIKTLPHKHKDGLIIEGALWSNGMFFIEKSKEDIINAVLFIDQYTKDLYRYP